MMRLFAGELAPTVYIHDYGISEGLGRKAGGCRHFPPREKESLNTYAAEQKPANFHGLIAESTDVVNI